MKSRLKEDTTPTKRPSERELDLYGHGERVGIAARFAGHGLRYICGAKITRITSKSTNVEMPLDGREITFARSTGIEWGKHNKQSHPERWELVKYVAPGDIDPERYVDHHFAELHAEEPFTEQPIGKPSESEIYRFLYLEFDVRQAFEIIRDSPRKPVQLDPEEWIGPVSRYKFEDKPVQNPDAILQYRRDPKLSGWTLSMGTAVEWEAVPRCDPGLAGIIAFLSEGYQMIDGSHRLARAWQTGQEHFYAYPLTPEESLEVCPRLEEVREGMGTTAGASE